MKILREQRLSGWRTFAYGALIIAVSALSDAQVQAFVGQNLPWVGGAVGALVIVLRAITDSPIFQPTERRGRLPWEGR